MVYDLRRFFILFFLKKNGDTLTVLLPKVALDNPQAHHLFRKPSVVNY